jgi:hypothetical protein
MGKFGRRRAGIFGGALVSAGLMLLGPGTGRGTRADEPPRANAEEALARVDRLEELLLKLTPEVQDLDTSVLNLNLPDAYSHHLFAQTVTVTDLSPTTLPPASQNAGLTAARQWPIDGEVRSTTPRALRLWRPFLDRVDFFTQAHFKLVRGRFLDPAETRYAADVRFEGVARMSSGLYDSVDAKLEISWSRQAVPGAPSDPGWRIDAWRTKTFGLVEAARPLFAEVLDRAIPDPADLKRARTSLQESLVIERLRDPKLPKPHKYFQFQSLNQHPGLSVVDVDRDGFDDLYVMERWGPNLLLRNRGDGTFEEIAAKLGLNITDHTSCALFADFDNDGDLDVFLGRTLAPSMYLVNEGGRFVDRSRELVGSPLPALVSSISAVDYDGDGLLDVYFSTYAIDDDLAEEFLPVATYNEIHRRWRDGGHLFRNRPGPPNVLLRNVGGGRFELAPTAGELAVWRNTFQSTWSDFDNDGDMDVYVVNDFAPNNLLRNDGHGHFVDVTEETGTADLGFGMGASWGDYDNDGRQDLYVSNMYSTAGRRITEEMGELAAQVAPMARGNSLFRNLGDRFLKVSGLEPPALQVERVGWAWGGQFLDVDNDGYLDIYSLSGYYTAPKLNAFQPDL